MTNTIGRYELRGELGRGGMAAVYRAYDALLNREVALKVMAGHLATDASFHRRFEREAKVIATLEHPSIVPVYDYGITPQGQPYLVMRLLRGGTLHERLAAGKVTQQQLWAILRQVAAALDYAHDRDIVHRDIKPVNVLFDEKGNAYVSDFGIAKVRDATTNLTGNAIVGTAAYMSPEQFMGATVDGRSDQYSLAIVVFEALSGRAPFVSDTLHGLMFQHINEPPPDVHSLNRALPPAVSAVLRRAMAKNPGDRFANATDFIQMLEAGAGGSLKVAEAPHLRQLQQDYDTGLKAYQQSDWPTAVDFLGRVVALDTGYRNAAQLHETARFRLQEQRRAAPATEVVGGTTSRLPTQVVPGAGGVAQPAPRQKSRLPLLLGLLALLVVGGVAAFFLLRQSPEPTTPDDGATAIAVVAPSVAAADTPEPPTPTPTPLPTVPPPVAGAALVVEVGSASVSTDGGRAQPLANGAELPLQAGTQVRLAVDEGRTQLVMPNGARLYLDAGSEASLSVDDAGAPLITVERGRLLAWSHAEPVAIASAFDGRATLLGAGLMGVMLNPGAVRFEVSCLEGSCDVNGPNDPQALRLRNGQMSVIGADDFADRPTAAVRGPFDALLADEAVAVAEVPPTEAATAAPTEEPTAAPTAAPTEAPTTAPAATATRSGGSATSGSGSNTATLGPAALDFEAFGTWRRGDQENGTLTQSTAQAQSGSRSAALAYDFPTANNDFVVFTQEHDIAGEPNLLRLWVHGDDSGHFLNAWIVDDEGQTWQVPFGRVTHRGWQQMEGRIATGQNWPWTHISGPNNDQVDYPIRFRSFVLDDSPDTFTGTGTIYLDDLSVATGQAGSAPQPTAAPGATAAAGVTPTAAAPAGGAGAILFTAGDSLLTVDPGGQPRILGTATRNTCSSPAEAGGVSYNLVAPGPGCAAVGDGQANCASPNGQFQVLMGRPDGGTRNVSLVSPANPAGDFIFNRAVDPAEGILWSPNSNSFLIVIGDEVVQVFTDLSFRVVVSSVPAFCPRWSAGP